MGSTFEEKLKQFAINSFETKASSEVCRGPHEATSINETLIKVLLSNSKLGRTLLDLIIEYIAQLQFSETFDIVCGVSYVAVHIATGVCLEQNIPMVMRRKAAKAYGTKQLIEGKFNVGDRCLILEDTILSGQNILNTAIDLRNSGIECQHALVVFDQGKGGAELLEKNGIKMHSLLNFNQLKMWQEGKLCGQKISRLNVEYGERAKAAQNSVAKTLFELMESKKTNLCVAADVTTAEELLKLAEQVGPHICLFKTHIDTVSNFSASLITNLKEAAAKYNFILFEDKKFNHVGETLKLHYTQTEHKIASWASIVTAHSLKGNDVLRGIQENKGSEDRGVFLLAEASSAENFTTSKYTKATIDLAAEYQELITGIVCQSPLFLDQHGWIQLTPGVKLGATGDGLQQQYDTPENAVIRRGADVVVVGRGITQSKDPEKEALKYKEASWNAYLKRLYAQY